MSSVLELVEAYKSERLTQAHFQNELQRYLDAAELRIKNLQSIQVPEEDRDLWQNLLKPGLHLMTRCLISAVKEALAYAQSRNRNLLPGIFALLKQMQHMAHLLENQLESASTMTRHYLHTHLKMDDLNIQADTGQARSHISFLDLDD